MKVILIQAGNFKFYYGRYRNSEDVPNTAKQGMILDEDKDLATHPHVEIPIFVVQLYNNKGPKEDKSIDSVWESPPKLDKIALQTLQNAGYGSKHLVITLLSLLNFTEIESKEEKKKIEVYTSDQIETAYKESDELDKVLKGNMM